MLPHARWSGTASRRIRRSKQPEKSRTDIHRRIGVPGLDGLGAVLSDEYFADLRGVSHVFRIDVLQRPT